MPRMTACNNVLDDRRSKKGQLQHLAKIALRKFHANCHLLERYGEPNAFAWLLFRIPRVGDRFRRTRLIGATEYVLNEGT